MGRWFVVRAVKITVVEIICAVAMGTAVLFIVGAVLFGQKHQAPAPPPPPPAVAPEPDKPPVAERAGDAVGRNSARFGRGLFRGLREEIFGKDE